MRVSNLLESSWQEQLPVQFCSRAISSLSELEFCRRRHG